MMYWATKKQNLSSKKEEDQGHRIGNNLKAKSKTKWTATYCKSCIWVYYITVYGLYIWFAFLEM